jgi:signal transduction histidine kinase
MKHRTELRTLCLALIVFLAGVLPVSSATRNVLLLFDERLDMPGLAAIDTDLVRTVTSNSVENIEVYREPMDLSRFGSETYQLQLRDFLRAKYVGKNIDVVVAIMKPALDFLLAHGDAIFPATPIIFGGIDRQELVGRTLPDHVRGVLLKREFAPTLELALRLHPQTTHVAVVAGTSEFDVRLLEQAKQEFRPYENRLSFTYLTTPRLEELLVEVSKLPPQTVVLFTTLFRDGAGNPFVPHNVVSRISAAANAPTYGFLDQYVGRGIVGGQVYSAALHGTEAGKLVLQALADPKAPGAHFVEAPANKIMFDWRQMQRWGIAGRQLPANSEINFRELTVWERYRWQITSALVALLLQSAIIMWFLLERFRRRRAETRSRTLSLQVMHLNRAAEAGALSASFAHDLGQPTLAIALNAQRAESLLKDRPELSTIREAVIDISRANDHAAGVIKEFQKLLKLRSDPEIERATDLNAAIADALSILSTEANHRQVDLVAEGHKGPLRVSADPTHVLQVLLNLATNAMDAMSDNPSDTRRVTIRTEMRGDSEVEIEVVDSGPGISEEVLDKIFDTFYTTKPHGTGLGLSIARTIVDTYGGKIWAGNRTQGGAAFHLTLPLSTDKPAQSKASGQRFALVHADA